jgi:hypothetical protein
VYLNFTSLLNDRDVFLGDTFYSLEATQGGAVFTLASVSVKECHFANNSASNNEGNDIYSTVTDGWYGNTNNIQNCCSLSLIPGQIKVSSGVCIFNRYNRLFLVYIDNLR